MTIATTIAHWQQTHGRHHLPWQCTDPYKVWLSEIMLQQTQVQTVVHYYQRFVQRFPTVETLAQASQDEVMALWSGLGYYARARHLHQCAKIIVTEYHGQFPQDVQQLVQLPGIGQSTAHAIAAFCFAQRTPILDGNVKRVLARYYAIAGYDQRFLNTLWQQAWQMIEQAPADLDMRAYTQGLMDLGSTVCTLKQAQCTSCPLHMGCQAYQNNQVSVFPHKKPPRQRPLKNYYLLFLSTPQQVFLVKRPNRGIWGGLWCVPEFPDLDALQHSVAQLPTVTVYEGTPLRHPLTHYELQLYPYYIHLPQALDSVSGLQGQWCTQQSLADYGLPQPVKQLLESPPTMLEAHWLG